MATSHTSEPNRAKLSDRQLKILDFIESFIAVNGYPPTIREIGEAVDIGSTSVVNYNLNKLVREGFLERSKKVSRGLQLVKGEDEEEAVRPRSMRVRGLSRPDVLHIPLAGQIVASKPVEFFDYHHDEDETIEVPLSLIGNVPQDQVFALRVHGHSMIDAMVDEGDVVILRRQATADDKDMVAVWLKDSNETTLKYFYREGSRIRLQPAHPQMDPIYVDAKQVEIQGRVLAVLRSL
ncbi:MAG: transcriptional repressor LexA [Anaerolineae bacterium]|nr:MAG: repressor LexA [Anaerolineae bacterium]MCL4880183.1 transcriptional repressor LexA [Anaerolineae bacterium]